MSRVRGSSPERWPTEAAPRATGARPGPAARDAAHPPLRGEGRRAVHAGEDPRLPPPLHRRGGGRRRRDAGADAGRRGRRDLPRARPRARARPAGRRR